MFGSTASSASSPTSRCRFNLVLIVGCPGAARRDADLAGHRRYRADHRHGGRLQRADLRAHPRGGEEPDARSSRRSSTASRGASPPSSMPTSRSLIAAVVLFYSAPARCAALPSRSPSASLTTVFTAFTLTRLLRLRLAAPRHPKASAEGRPLTGLFDGTNIRFMGIRRYTFTLSAVLSHRCLRRSSSRSACNSASTSRAAR